MLYIFVSRFKSLKKVALLNLQQAQDILLRHFGFEEGNASTREEGKPLQRGKKATP